MTTAVTEIQEQHWEWAQRNFDAEKGWEQALHPLAGVTEEIGELSFAEERSDTLAMKDAIGDVMIYLLDVCNRTGIKIDNCPKSTPAVVNAAIGGKFFQRVWKPVGALNHAVLKTVQKIRGEEEHEQAARDAVGSIVDHLDWYSRRLGWDLWLEIVFPVWEKVSQRNWKPEREGRGTSSRNDN